jgi:hypothetical protein
MYSKREPKLTIIEVIKSFALKVQEEVRQLLCLLTRDNPRSTEDLRTLLMDRIALTLRGHVASSDLAFAVRHEMALLAALVQKEDSCWEQKLRYKLYVQVTVHHDKLRIKQPTRCIKCPKFILS